MVSNPESAASNAAASAASAEASEPETWAVPSVAGVSLLPAEVKPMGLAEASVDVENGLTESVEVPAVSASAAEASPFSIFAYSVAFWAISPPAGFFSNAMP